MKRHTFETLSGKSMAELEQIRTQLRDELSSVYQGKFDLCASILFFQSEIEKEKRTVELPGDGSMAGAS